MSYSGTLNVPNSVVSGLKTTNYTCVNTDEIILCDTVSTPAFTVTLPNVATISAGKKITVNDKGGNCNIEAVTVDTFGSETIGGSNSVVISVSLGSLSFVFDGTDWQKIASANVGDMAASVYDPANIAQQVVGLTATQTVSNKTFDTTNSVNLVDTGLVISNQADPTKSFLFGTSLIGGGNQRLINIPDEDGTIALANGSDDIEITDHTKGIVLTASDASRWRVTVNTLGVLVVTGL